MPIRKGRRSIPPAVTFGAVPPAVPMILQTQTQWCWAACAEMVLRYYGKQGVGQCDLANWLFGQSACCVKSSSSLCNRPCQTQDVARVFSNWGIRSSLVGSSIPFKSLDAEISNSRPVEVGYVWTGGGGHVVLVVQTRIEKNRAVCQVNDPGLGSGGVYYNDLLKAYGQGRWFVSWTGIQ